MSFNFKDQNNESKYNRGCNPEWLDWWFQVLIGCDKCKQKAVEKGNRLNMPSSSVISLNNANHSHKYTQRSTLFLSQSDFKFLVP